MGFERVFDNLTFKRMDALRKQIQSLDYVWNHCFWTHEGPFPGPFLQIVKRSIYDVTFTTVIFLEFSIKSGCCN